MFSIRRRKKDQSPAQEKARKADDDWMSLVVDLIGSDTRQMSTSTVYTTQKHWMCLYCQTINGVIFVLELLWVIDSIFYLKLHCYEQLFLSTAHKSLNTTICKLLWAIHGQKVLSRGLPLWSIVVNIFITWLIKVSIMASVNFHEPLSEFFI